VEPRDAISASIPLIIELLKDQHDEVRSAAAFVLGELAEQREFWPDTTVTSLI
jgi:HEAT repeat protein